ncbi:HAD family hydrolase [Desulfotomaculum sp. 1211_IL3151]|uniref:HAD family hydrolase n=1 Tax=Desulfotomaculum sp. 1211_IL3151 TaxID=3084055 RepID=UPI002FDA1B1E
MIDFQAAIFDLDGTLLDSMGVWEDIDVEFLAKRELSVPDDYINEICALSFQEAAEYTIKLFGLSEEPAAIINEWNDMALSKYSHTVRMKQYAGEYLSKLKARGTKLAVATGLPPVLYIPALRNNGILDLFDVLCSTEEVARGKEFPDIFLYAAERMKVAPENCIVFEDIFPAVCSARQAGMKVYGVYDKSSAAYWESILKTADGVLYDFQFAPIPV